MDVFNNNSIGVMDSGVGGLTVLKQLQAICPNENFLYFGDTKNLPYGEKTKEELIKIVKEIFDYFETQKVKAVVLACNTTSATAYDELKDKYNFKIYPLIQVVSKCLAMDNTIKRIGVMATQATVNSKKYTSELVKNNSNISVIEQACPLFVPIVEKQISASNKEEIVKQYLTPVLKFNPDKIILGCTHYPYLLDDMAKFATKNLFINPAEMFAKYIKDDLAESNLLSNLEYGTTNYFASSNPEDFKRNADLFLTLDKVPELVNL